jgi:antitoxin ParD1/3/4
METMNIALPKPMKVFVQKRVAQGGYSSVSEYLRNLIREDQKKDAAANLEMLLLEGLKGKGAKATPQWWDDFRAGILQRHKKAKGK